VDHSEKDPAGAFAYPGVLGEALVGDSGAVAADGAPGPWIKVIDQTRCIGCRARQALWRQARRALLWEHLLTWAVTYARAMAASAPPFHAAWAELLERTLLAEAADLEPPATPSLHLRDSPGLPEASEGAAALVGVLLAPVRSGLILTRWDLARGAPGLGLGLRMGERAFALRSMLSQDPQATLAWLAGEAAGWAARHRQTVATLGDIGRHWRERAETTLALLLELERAAEEVTAHAAGR